MARLIADLTQWSFDPNTRAMRLILCYHDAAGTIHTLTTTVAGAEPTGYRWLCLVPWATDICLPMAHALGVPVADLWYRFGHWPATMLRWTATGEADLVDAESPSTSYATITRDACMWHAMPRPLTADTSRAWRAHLHMTMRRLWSTPLPPDTLIPIPDILPHEDVAAVFPGELSRTWVTLRYWTDGYPVREALLSAIPAARDGPTCDVQMARVDTRGTIP